MAMIIQQTILRQKSTAPHIAAIGMFFEMQFLQNVIVFIVITQESPPIITSKLKFAGSNPIM